MSTYNPAGGGTYNLGSSIGSTDTTILLSSFTEPVSGTAYTMALLNTDIAYGTIAPKTTSSEFISFTGITQNADGTATLTGVVRGLAKKYPFTSDVTFKLPHSGQSQFILSDVPQIFVKYASLEDDNVFSGTNEHTGVETFDVSPQVPGGATGSGAINADQLAAAVFSGASDTSTTVTGITRTSASSDTTIGTFTVTIATPAVFTHNSHGLTVNDSVRFTTTGALPTGLAVGTTYYVISTGLTTNAFEVSTTRGGSAVNTSGTQSGTHTLIRTTPIQVGTLDTRVPTQSENDALVGDNTDVAVGTGNKFVTQTGLQKQVESYAVSTGSANAYVVALTPIPTSYAAGMMVHFKANFTNTGAATVNINSLGAKTIKKFDGATDLAAGDIANGQLVVISYDGTNFQLVSPSALLANNPALYTVNADETIFTWVTSVIGIVMKASGSTNGWTGTWGTYDASGNYTTVNCADHGGSRDADRTVTIYLGSKKSRTKFMFAHTIATASDNRITLGYSNSYISWDGTNWAFTDGSTRQTFTAPTLDARNLYEIYYDQTNTYLYQNGTLIATLSSVDPNGSFVANAGGSTVGSTMSYVFSPITASVQL